MEIRGVAIVGGKAMAQTAGGWQWLRETQATVDRVQSQVVGAGGDDNQPPL